MGMSTISVLKYLWPQISFVAKYLIQAPIRKELGNQRRANNGEGNEQIAEIVRIFPQFRVSTTAQPPIDPVCDCTRPNFTWGELAIMGLSAICVLKKILPQISWVVRGIFHAAVRRELVIERQSRVNNAELDEQRN
jgi:hypothetical protein